MSIVLYGYGKRGATIPLYGYGTGVFVVPPVLPPIITIRGGRHRRLLALRIFSSKVLGVDVQVESFVTTSLRIDCDKQTLGTSKLSHQKSLTLNDSTRKNVKAVNLDETDAKIISVDPKRDQKNINLILPILSIVDIETGSGGNS